MLHPLYENAGSVPVPRQEGPCKRRLFTFQQLPCRPSQEMVAMGVSDSQWRILGSERIITGEYLVTLKARHTLGVLPELNSNIVPKRGREKAIETFEKLVDSAYHETPGSKRVNDKPTIILSASRIVARLHARGKPNEQEKRSLRPLMEADAEFALAALGLLLREFGWTH